YYSVLGSWENRVFDRSLKKLHQQERLHASGFEDQIVQVLAHYKTGLKKDRLQHVPEWIMKESSKYGYDPLLLTALIINESSFYNWAQSNKGALGLMQVRPATGEAMAMEIRMKWKGKSTLHDPEANIALGAYYLNKMILRFGDLGLALEAYNHGPSQLSRYLRKGYRPKRYSQKVFQQYNRLRFRTI
ncbi:MAG: lytic transglycosylase domain-containing protein, partial [Desulfobacterales bacterium]|nr:lytic transglycosylase domain-containing protein [Desulfobacterales bacterium]